MRKQEIILQMSQTMISYLKHDPKLPIWAKRRTLKWSCLRDDCTKGALGFKNLPANKEHMQNKYNMLTATESDFIQKHIQIIENRKERKITQIHE